LIVGGDFNTNHDQAMFAAEKTLDILTDAAYRSAFERVPFTQRITHPGSHGYPDATFDYLFGKDVRIAKPIITQTNLSDHLPVTCDVELYDALKATRILASKMRVWRRWESKRKQCEGRRRRQEARQTLLPRLIP
jgi:hypothetical protein